MWFRKDQNKTASSIAPAGGINGKAGKIRRKKVVLVKSTRSSAERDLAEEKDSRRYSDITDGIRALERRQDSEESIYESAENDNSRSTSDEALARLAHIPAAEAPEVRKKLAKPQGHRKTMSLSNPIELVKSMGDEWLEMAKRELEEHSKRKVLQRKKSKDSSNEDLKLNIVIEKDPEPENNQTKLLQKPESLFQVDKPLKKTKDIKPSKKETCKLVEDSKATAKKIAKAGSVHALSFMRKKRAPPCAMKAIEAVTEMVDKNLSDQTVASTIFFLKAEKHHSSDLSSHETTPEKESTESPETIEDEETEVEEDECDTPEAQTPTPQINGEIRHHSSRRLSRTNSRSKSKIRGKSQGVRVNTLRKSQSGTLKRVQKKKLVTPSIGRSRHPSVVEPIVAVEDLIAAVSIPKAKKKSTSSIKSQSNWFFGGSFKGENRREGSEESSGATAEGTGEADTSHETDKENADKDLPKHETQGLWRGGGWGGKPVARAESCRDAAGAPGAAAGGRRGKQRNASDPNRLTAAHQNSDAETLPGANDPSVSSSSSSLSARSNDSNTNVDPNQGQSQSSSSDDEERLGEQWISSVSAEIVESLSSRHRKRQEVIHELITSERSHIRWLRVLHALYLRPLERPPTPPAPRLPTMDELTLRALMPNLPVVREKHARLYTDLRALRKGQDVVTVRSVADAVLNTLGSPDYVVTVSVFCRGQRRALDSLRERRRKAKELHAFLARAEQAPKCGRLQLRDLLACVWQRLTKYQLLLESILKTVTEEDAEAEEDVERLRLALATAKEVLQGVDAAVRQDENKHRLSSIQSKMEVRTGVSGGGVSGGVAGGAGGSGSTQGASSADVEEMKRLDLTAHNLLLEGELTVRQDTNKKTNVLALLLEDCLVLLHKDGDKFVLKQINQPSQQTLLSPIVKWSTVLFRPNAAVKNGFFLVNVNGIQMYELSTNTHTEYNTWSKHISEVPLAYSNRPASRSTTNAPNANNADSGVSRNPSNASAKSESSLTEASTVGSEDLTGDELNTSSVCPEGDIVPEHTDNDEKKEPQPQLKEQGGVCTNGRVIQHEIEDPGTLEAPGAVIVGAPPITQQAVLATTVQGRLRRLNETISVAMQAKSALVAQALGANDTHLLAEQSDTSLKVEELEEMLECMDIVATDRTEFDSCIEGSGLSDEDEGRIPLELTGRDRTVHQLLLAAQAQANQLQETLNRALDLTSMGCHNLAGWQREGLCDSCVGQPLYSNTDVSLSAGSGNPSSLFVGSGGETRCGVAIEKEISFDMLSELDRSCEELDPEEVDKRRQAFAEQRLGNVVLMEHIGESSTDPPPTPPLGCPPLPVMSSAQSLARALAPTSCALTTALSALAISLPEAARERTRLRLALRQANERYQRLAHRHKDCHGIAEVDSGGDHLDQNLQDQPNGGG